jgi:Berberine and berberine like
LLVDLGGAIGGVGEDETAYSGPTAGHTININGISETADGFDEQREWVGDLWAALEPHQTGVYVNFLMDEGEERIREAYGAEKYERLRALKRQYDPRTSKRQYDPRTSSTSTRTSPRRGRLSRSCLDR